MLQSFFRALLAVAWLLAVLLAAQTASAQSWTKLTVPATSPTPALYAAQFFTRDTGFVCGVAGSTPTGRLYATVDGGTTWSQVSLPGSPLALNDIAFIPALRFGVVVGDGGYVAVTTDRGQTWTQRSVSITAWTTGVDINGVYFKDSSNGFIVGNPSSGGSGPRFARTTNSGRTWTSIAQNDPPSNNLYDLIFFDAQHGVVVGTGTPPRKSLTTDGGQTWSALDSVGIRASSSLSIYGVDAVPGTGTAFAAGGRSFATPYYPEVRRSTDYGATWQPTTMSGPSSGYSFPGSDAAAVSDSVVYLCGWNANIHKSNNGGASWRAETLPTTVAASVDFRKFARTPDNWLYVVGTAGTVLRIELVPNATFSASSIDFGANCSGDPVPDQSLTIGNDRDGVLSITGVGVAQPSGGVTFQVTSQPASLLAARTTTRLTVHVNVPAGVPSGTYTGALRIRTNDENFIGADTLRTIPLSVTVRTKTLSYDPAVSRDAGRVRTGGMIQLTLAMNDVIRDTSECPVSIDSARMAIGLDFTLTPVASGTLAARTGKRSLEVFFVANAVCARYDTVLVFHSGEGSPLRIPVVGTGTEPSFATSPADTLDVGGTAIGRPVNGTLAVRNDRQGTCLDSALLTGFRITGPNATEFSTSFSLSSSRYIAPGGTLSIPVTATPGGPGRRIAYAIFRSEVLGDAPDTVVLVVNGLEAQFTSIKPEIVFDTTDVGGRLDSTVKSFLVNYGTLAVRIDSFAITGTSKGSFTLTAPAVPVSLGTNENTSIVMSFMPDKVGRFEAQLMIYTDLSSKPIPITLVGYGALPSIAVRPLQVAFMQTPVNTCSDTIIERFIYNSSPVPLRIRGTRMLPVTGADPNDTLAFIVQDPAIPPELVIPPRDSARVTLRFCPKRSGVHRAMLELIDNIADSEPPEILLLGNGQSGTAVSIDTIRFASTRVLTSRDSIVLKLIFNKLAGPLNVDSMSVSGADALSFELRDPSAPFFLSPAHDTAVTVRFRPMRRGDHYAFLNIYTSQGPHTVVLTGHATFPFLKIEPRNLADLRVRRGSTRHILFDVTNAGDDSARIDGAAISGDPAFTSPNVGSFPQRLLPTEKLTVAVDFTPSHLCEHPVEIRIRGEGVQGSYASADTVVAANGIGVIPMIATRRSEILFGTRTSGSANDSAMSDFLGNVDFGGTISACVDDGSIDSMTIAGPGASAFSLVAPTDPLLPRGVAAGTFVPLTIRFSPGAPGLSSAELRIYRDGDPDSMLTVRLAGAAANLSIEYGPAPNMIEIDFGNVHPGWLRDSTFTVTNSATEAILLDALAPSPTGEFTVTTGGTLPQTLEPGLPAIVHVQFTPSMPFGLRKSAVVVGSGGTRDSVFTLRARVVTDRLRTPSLVDFGARAAGVVADSVVTLRNDTSSDFPDGVYIDQVPIDRVVVIDGGAWFEAVSFPTLVGANARDSMTLRFHATGASGVRTGLARMYFNKRSNAAATIVDSIDIQLRGVVGSDIALSASMGSDQSGAPGDRIRVPIILDGEAIPDTIAMTVSYGASLLRPLQVIPSRAGIGGSFGGSQPAAGKPRATATILIGGSGVSVGGAVAEIEFEVLLGDTLAADVRYDSISAPSHPEVTFSTIGMRFTVDGFCDASGRRIRFDLGPALGSKVRPGVRGATIDYAVPALEPVRLSVYDALGREVARLAEGTLEPGLYSARFDATGLASGPYYCLLVAGRFSKTLTIQVTE